MLIKNSNGTYIGGQKDVICILNNIETGKYHAAFFEESPMPGNPSDLSFVRLKSKMHHTGGADTLELALSHVEELKSKIEVPEENVWLDPQEWNGDKGVVWVVPKW